MGMAVALLRGINVGRAKRVAMSELRATFAELGYADAQTVLQSGNVVFTAAALPTDAASALTDALERRVGVRANMLLIPAAEFLAIAAANPLLALASDPARLIVSFMAAPPEPAWARDLDAAALAPEVIAIGERAIYQWCPDGVLASKVPASFWKRCGPALTARNWRTVTTLAAMLQPSGASAVE